VKKNCCAVLIFLSCFLCCSKFASSQNTNSDPLITGDFKHLTIDEFAKALQQQTGLRFYYDTAQFDSITIDISVKEKSLKDVLQLALANTNFRFSIDRHKNVFITNGIAVQTELADDFFDSSKKIKGKDQPEVVIDDYEENERKKDSAILGNKLYVVGEKSLASADKKVSVAGYVKDVNTGEPVVGASIYIEDQKIGVTTDQFGYYSVSLSQGRHMLNIQSIGMRDTRRQVIAYSDGKMNIEMKKQVMTLKKVIVSAEKASNIKSLQMGLQKLDIKTIKQVPVVFGEADILKVALTMPGVQTVGEASTGLNVRGGSADQNLILFNDATIYNPSHFFGMFSAFNPEVVKDVELYKSSIPAKYGGRLSSVLEVNSREGNKKDFAGSAGVGLLTSRLNIEGPLIKDKSSFIFGARTTYANWLLNLLPDQYKNSRASFYDLNLNISHQINKKNDLYLTAYMSNDHFNLNNDTTYGYDSKNISLKWKHVFNNKIYSLISGGYDRYEYYISSDINPLTAYKFSFNINQTYFKAHFNYYASTKHTIEFGLNSLFYKLHPGTYVPMGSQSLVALDEVNAEQALESALYVSDKYTVTDAFSIEGGIRYSMFNYLGPQTINNYPPGVPKTADDIVSTTSYSGGKIIKTYKGPEFRLSARYALTSDLSVKAGFNSQRQYIHALSNTAAIAPTDIWKLSDPNIKPQFGDQVSLGVYKNLKSNTIETSLEVYYKSIKDYLDYKSGAQLVLNHHIETDVLNTKGKAYGIEFQVKKLTGKLNGWISYTYSRTLLKVDDPTAGQTINNGSYYPADYDKPHDFTLVSNYKFSHRYSISFNATYSTGRPITLPIGKYYYSGSERALYSDRNAYRIPDYFRTDLSIYIDGNHKVHQKTHNSWSIGVYNLTGRKNPYSVYYVSENGVVNGYKLSIFGSAIPFINFNIRF
jgi:hypothetical protein